MTVNEIHSKFYFQSMMRDKMRFVLLKNSFTMPLLHLRAESCRAKGPFSAPCECHPFILMLLSLPGAYRPITRRKGARASARDFLL